MKLLADIGYIADRLRSLEQRWELAELKDLHKRIVLSFDDPPVNVVCAIRDGQLRPVQSELHGNSQLQQEVEQAAQAAQEVETAKRNQRLQSAHQQQGQPDPCDGDDETQAKLVQLEDFLIALHRSYAEVRRASQKCKKKQKARDGGANDKVFPFLSLSSSQTFTSSSNSTEASSPQKKCNRQCATDEEPKQPLEQEQSFTTSQADRTMNQDREPEDPNVVPEQQTKSPPAEEAASNPSQQVNTDNQSDAKQEPQAASAGDNCSQHNSSSSTNSCSTTPQKSASGAITEQSTKEEDEDDTTGATITTTATATTVVNVESESSEQQQKRPSFETFSSSPLSSRTAPRGCGAGLNGDSTEPDEEEETDEEDGHDAERNKLRKRISELTNNFASAKQYQQMCDNIDTINDAELRALIRELKRKIEFAERMNWLCEYSLPLCYWSLLYFVQRNETFLDRKVSSG